MRLQCLTCVVRKHESVCEVVHGVYNRLLLLEARVRTLEERK